MLIAIALVGFIFIVIATNLLDIKISSIHAFGFLSLCIGINIINFVFSYI